MISNLYPSTLWKSHHLSWKENGRSSIHSLVRDLNLQNIRKLLIKKQYRNPRKSYNAPHDPIRAPEIYRSQFSKMFPKLSKARIEEQVIRTFEVKYCKIIPVVINHLKKSYYQWLEHWMLKSKKSSKRRKILTEKQSLFFNQTMEEDPCLRPDFIISLIIDFQF